MNVNSNNYKVSIVLPVFNGERFLRDALDSILKQTYDNYELIIVDDCSTDDSHRIAEDYARKDERIRLHRNEKNEKLPKSLNIGFSKATGDLYTWTSDDNILKPNTIEELVNQFQMNSSVDFVYADITPIDEWGRIKKMKYLNGEIDDIYLYNPILACFLYKKKIHDVLKGYDSHCLLYEDYDFWLRTYEAGFRMIHYKKQLYYYRFHQASLTSMNENSPVLNKESVLKNNLLRCRDYGMKIKILSKLDEIRGENGKKLNTMDFILGKLKIVQYSVMRLFSNYTNHDRIISSNSRVFFDSIANSYEKQEWFDEPEKCYSPVLGILNKEKSLESLIDIGCGTGRVIEYIKNNNKNIKRITGVDISPNMIKIAEKRTQNDKRIDYIVGSITDIELPRGCYSAAVCMHSFHHYPQPVPCLKKIYECMKTGSILIIADNRLVGSDRIKFNLRQMINGYVNGDRWMYSEVEARILVYLVGFRDVSYRCVGEHSFVLTCRKR